MASTTKVLIQVNDEIVELTGDALKAFEADRKASADAQALLEAEQATRKQLRETAIRQLAQTANLSEEQIETLLGGI